MSWKENRRRKRVWYQHYRGIANDLMTLANRGGCSGEELLMLFFNLYESRRLHGKRRIANSAIESILLVLKDTGLAERKFTSAAVAPSGGDGTYTITVSGVFGGSGGGGEVTYAKDDYKEVPF